MRDGQTENIYQNPETPIYVVQGTAGALINEKWIDPKPEWSVKRILKYGFGGITIKENLLEYQYVSAMGGKVLDRWSIQKTD